MTQLFSYPVSYDNDILPFNNYETHTCSEESFSPHPQCVMDCTFCKQQLKPVKNFNKHNNLKHILKFEQESKNTKTRNTDIPNDVFKKPNNTAKLIETARPITPTLHQVKVNPDPKGMPLLNNLR